MSPRHHHGPRSARLLIPPEEACWIESDAYDRAAFGALSRESPSLATLLEEGGTLLPHFRALAADLYCLLYKENVVFRPAYEVAASAAFNRLVLDALNEHPALAALRLHTLLDEPRAALGAVLLGERVLAAVKKAEVLARGDLRDLWELACEEEQARELAEAAAEETEPPASDPAPGAAAGQEKKGVHAAGQRASESRWHAASVAAATLRQKSSRMGARLAEVASQTAAVMARPIAAVAAHVADTEIEAAARGLGCAGGGGGSVARQLELARRLAGNAKLKRLARLAGRMREQALALRRRTLERACAEVHDVTQCGHLSRLLPTELLALGHSQLGRDFRRRLLEGQLLAYELKGPEERGRGPLVVCLDGSSSMAGDKELWGKAVSLTLLEIARRQRRLCRFICFASADTPLFSLDLNPRTHYQVDDRRVLDAAEYFPGGGTDFEKPLSAAVDCLGQRPYRRGDIVLISDGQCQVSAAWLARFRAEKRRLGFALFSIMIDVGPSELATLREISDRVTSVSTLTREAARELFLSL